MGGHIQVILLYVYQNTSTVLHSKKQKKAIHYLGYTISVISNGGPLLLRFLCLDDSQHAFPVIKKSL